MFFRPAQRTASNAQREGPQVKTLGAHFRVSGVCPGKVNTICWCYALYLLCNRLTTKVDSFYLC